MWVVERVVAWEIADLVNPRTGYAWASQEWMAARLGCSERALRDVTAVLCDDVTGWFRRELEGPPGRMNYVYHPRWERLSTTVENTGDAKPTRRQNRVRPTGKSRDEICRLSSLRDPYKREILAEAPDQPSTDPPATDNLIGGNVDRPRKVIDLGNQDEIITAAAQAEGNGQFVYYNSRAWRSWNDFYVRQGKPPLCLEQTRQHMMNGVVRVGIDLPSVFPPGYSQYGDGIVVPPSSSGPKIECSAYLAENIRRRGVQPARNQLQNKFDENGDPK
jgi:hypothetical protein